MLRKKCLCEKHIDLTTSLITTWFISESRKSCDWKTSAQSNQKMVFKIFTGRRNFFCLSQMMNEFDRWPVYLGEQFRASSWPSCSICLKTRKMDTVQFGLLISALK